MKAPFPWFGGKSRVADDIWLAFGDVANFVEPFFGSGAVLLGRPNFSPDKKWTETVNDADGFVANFWRALKHDPEAVAFWADYPVNETDLHARHGWLINRRERLEWSLGDPDFYDPKIAGWWVWGLCSWIGSGWCSGSGPWRSNGVEIAQGNAGRGINRQLPHLGDAGKGINRAGNGITGMLCELSERLRHVRVCAGDWSRVLGDSPTIKHGITGVFLDPPYSAEADREMGLYATDCGDVAHAAREWAIANGDNPAFRIALCGYDTEHAMPADWVTLEWKAPGGYGSQGDGKGRANAGREVVWFSPYCHSMKTVDLFHAPQT
jgi:hypothetical protein